MKKLKYLFFTILIISCCQNVFALEDTLFQCEYQIPSVSSNSAIDGTMTCDMGYTSSFGHVVLDCYWTPNGGRRVWVDEAGTSNFDVHQHLRSSLGTCPTYATVQTSSPSYEQGHFFTDGVKAYFSNDLNDIQNQTTSSGKYYSYGSANQISLNEEEEVGEELVCYYNMGDNNPQIIVTVDKNQKVSAREDRTPQFYPVYTSNLLIESFLSKDKTELTCPNNIYRAIGPSNNSYDLCVEREICRLMDLSFIVGELDKDKSSSSVNISETIGEYMSCEYNAHGGLPGITNAHVLYVVANGIPKFFIQYESVNDTIEYTLTPDSSFQIASSCEEQGSLWIDKTAKSKKTIRSEPDSAHSLEMTLVAEEDREILNQDQVNDKNGNEHTKPGFTPIRLCENGECDISLSGFCEIPTVSRTLKFLGILIYIAKIFVPVLIIYMGTRNLFLIITAGKTEDAKKYVVNILKRIGIAVLIFLLPGILQFVFDLASDIIGSKENNKASNCVNCILDPFDKNKCKIEESD